jgi:hypothetical protein
MLKRYSKFLGVVSGVWVIAMVMNTSTAFAGLDPIRLDGLETTIARWSKGMHFVFVGEAVAVLEPAVSVDGLYSESSYGDLARPGVVHRVRLRVDGQAVGSIVENHVEHWFVENDAFDTSAPIIEVGDRLIVTGGLWDLRSVFGHSSSELASPAYAAEAVSGAFDWRLLRSSDGSVTTFNGRIPVCIPPLGDVRMFMPCDGDSGATESEVLAHMASVWPTEGAALPGSP